MENWEEAAARANCDVRPERATWSMCVKRGEGYNCNIRHAELLRWDSGS